MRLPHVTLSPARTEPADQRSFVRYADLLTLRGTIMTVIQESAVGALDQPDTTAMKALAASTIGYAMDGFDLLILGFMLRAISADLSLTPAQAGSLVTWTLIGAVAGGILFGILSDYYGRVRPPRSGVL